MKNILEKGCFKKCNSIAENKTEEITLLATTFESGFLFGFCALPTCESALS